jgi:AcrR family transcriptional regulator
MLDCNVIKETKKKEKYRRRQIKVLDSAAAVFADKGYHGASTGEIAAKIGIAQSSLYYYFRSKDEALEMVCLHGTEGLLKRLQIIAASQQAPKQKIREAIFNHIQPIDTIPNYYITFIRELRYLPKLRKYKLNQMILDYNTIFVKILNEGIANATFKESLDCHLAMLQLISQCNNAAIWVNIKAEYNLEIITNSIADIFLSGVINHSN